MESTENNIDSYALYIFLFLSFLSVGNDFYHVYSNILEHEFVKKNINKVNNYAELFGNILCNNVKKTKNKLICDIKEKVQKKKKNNKKQEDKKENKDEIKEIKEKNELIQKPQIENEIIEKKTDNNYENNINIMRTIVKKDSNQQTKKKSSRKIKKET